MDYVDSLSKTFLFKDMPKAELTKLAKIVTEQKVPAHTILFNEGDAGKDMYVLVLGSAKVLKKDKGGDTQQVAVLGSGSYFGEMALVSDDHVRTATIETQELSIVLSVSQSKLEELCAQDDRFGHHFYRALSRGLERRLRSATMDAAYFKGMMRHHH